MSSAEAEARALDAQLQEQHDDLVVPMSGGVVTITHGFTRQRTVPTLRSPPPIPASASSMLRSAPPERSMSISDVLQAKRAESRRKTNFLKDFTIPWYIIDPTGEVIAEQREMRRRMKRLESPGKKLSRLQRLRVPTLYPGWDAITAIALIFTAVVTPFEVGYLPPPKNGLEPLFLINRIIDGIFILDMFFAFFLMYRVDSKEGNDAEWEMRLPKIAVNYLMGWFLIDLVSVATCLFDILPLCGVGSSVGGVKTLRTIRALRLVKLLRLIKSSKVLAKLAAYVTLSSFSRTILSLLFKLLAVVHGYACIVAIAATFPSTPLDSWLGTTGYCEPNPEADDPLASPRCVDAAYLYLKAVRWSMGLVAGGGFPMFPPAGPFPPYFSDANEYRSQFTIGEEVMLLILKTLGLLMWALIFSSLLKAVNQADPDAAAYNRDLDALNRFCQHNSIPGPLGREFRRYLAERRKTRLADSRTTVLSTLLSPVLLQKAGKIVNRQLMGFTCFKFAAKLPGGDDFVCAITLRMRAACYAPKDLVPPGCMYLITEGSVKRRDDILGPGSYWGVEDVIMSSSSAFKRASAVATTYLHVQCITRKHFDELKESFPEEHKAMRIWVYWYAVRNHMLDVYRAKQDEVLRASVAAAEGAVAAAAANGGGGGEGIGVEMASAVSKTSSTTSAMPAWWPMRTDSWL